MQDIDKLPQFNVQKLLELALRKLDASHAGGTGGHVVEAARNDIAAVLDRQIQTGDARQTDAEQVLRRTAKNLMLVNDLNVESARLAVMSAADMLR